MRVESGGNRGEQVSTRWMAVQYVGDTLRLPVVNEGDMDKPFGSSVLDRDVKRIVVNPFSDSPQMFVPELENVKLREAVKSMHSHIKETCDMCDGWVRLPVDADGEYIHIGDVMAYADNTKPMKVVALVPPAVFLTEDGPRYADTCRHYHAPTVEDVLREFAEKIIDSQIPGVHPTYEEVIAEYAAKLRLAEVDK